MRLDRLYVALWAGIAVLIVVAGLARLVEWSPSVAASAWVGGATMVLTVWVCRWPVDRPMRWREVVTSSITWTTFAASALGLLVTSRWSDALLLSTAALVAAAQARRARSGRPTGHRTDLGAQLVPAPAITDVDAVLPVTDDLTDDDLCRAWRSSYVALQRAPGVTARLRAVEFRRLVLDELGRRHPAGLQAWFDSGARAAGGPERFLRRTYGSADLRRDQPS